MINTFINQIQILMFDFENHSSNQDKSNEALEFLGDAIAKQLVGHYLYRRFKKQMGFFNTK